MGKLSVLLTVYELAFLLFRVKEAAQVEDDWQKEHEAGHGDDRHRLLTGDWTIEIFTPESAGHVHLKPKKPHIIKTSADCNYGTALLLSPPSSFSAQAHSGLFGAGILWSSKLLSDEAGRGLMSITFWRSCIWDHMTWIHHQSHEMLCVSHHIM